MKHPFRNCLEKNKKIKNKFNKLMVKNNKKKSKYKKTIKNGVWDQTDVQIRFRSAKHKFCAYEILIDIF